jgi:hypothetical protein
MPIDPSRLSSTLLVLALVGAATSARAQADAAPSPWRFGAAVSAAWFGDADLDGGGSVQLNSIGASLSVDYAASPRLSVGLGLSSFDHRFDFSGSGPVASLDPWSTAHLRTVSLPLRYSIDRQWGVTVVPSYQLATADDALNSEGGRYGAIAAVSYAWSPRQFVGVGLSYFTGLDDDTVFPILLVEWQLDEHWRLTNPLTAGPTGPAGLELVRRFDNGWEAGVGGAYRSLRFALNDYNALAPNGTGTYSGAIAFARLQYRLAPELSLSIFGGAQFGGELEIAADGGRTIVSVDHGTAPMVAISLSGRF